MDNPDSEVLELLARDVPADGRLKEFAYRLRMLAAQAGIAADRATGDAASPHRRRAAILTTLADRYDPTA